MLRTLSTSALLIAALAFTAPAEAEAAPASSMVQNTTPAAFGGLRIHVGGGVRVPIGRTGHRRVVRTTHVQPTGGYYKTVYETRIERVWHEPEFIGYDSHGQAVYSQGRWTEVEVQVPVRVWVPHRTVRTVRTVHHRRSRPVGHISIGGSWRIR